MAVTIHPLAIGVCLCVKGRETVRKGVHVLRVCARAFVRACAWLAYSYFILPTHLTTTVLSMTHPVDEYIGPLESRARASVVPPSVRPSSSPP